MDYKELILNKLLDKYEASRHYMGDAKVNRRIALPFNRRSFPQYDIEKTHVKDNIHFALRELQDKDLISIQWVRFEVGNIVDRVYLNAARIDNAYEEAGRKPKIDAVSEALHKLSELKKRVKAEWIGYFLEEQIKNIEERKSYTKYIPKEEDIQNLLMGALEGIDEKGEEELLERVFSKRYLKNSKIFETKVRSRICTIVRDFCLNGKDIEDEEALQEVGIIKTVEELLFCGPLKIKLMDSVIDFTPFYFGSSMNTDMIKSFQVLDINVDKVVTIENKANYLEYIKKETSSSTLVIYLGGFYSPVKRIFLRKVYNHIKIRGKRVQFYHWGDIDLGGFNIFMQLKSKIIEELKPYCMDAWTLRNHKNAGEAYDSSYRKKLEKLLEDREYAEFHEVIREMLKLGIKLEQEALL